MPELLVHQSRDKEPIGFIGMMKPLEVQRHAREMLFESIIDGQVNLKNSYVDRTYTVGDSSMTYQQW